MPEPAPPGRRSLSPSSFRSFHDAYAAVLTDLTRASGHISTRGNAGPERLNVSFQLGNPAARVPMFASRKANIVFNLAEVLWFLGGRDDLAMMRYYAPRMAGYSPDGVTIAGAAYGTRLFRTPGPGRRSAFDATLDLIREDPDTKRAVIPIFGAHEVGDGEHPDVSCTIAFQLFKREDRLHAVCYMRANDAFQGLVSDVFSFTFIQELAARLLDLRLGTYTHHVGSMHIGDQHLAKARAIVAEARQARPSSLPVTPMPVSTTRAMVEEVCAQEAQLRANRISHTLDSLAKTGLPAYWQRLIALLELHRHLIHEPGRPIDEDMLASLDPSHWWLLHHKWPARVPSPDVLGWDRA
ncbi:thymidylate synthase [Amycolatopsis saalfeldensis]|uniref:thymidylate synthase n=1 Tax=Amycolatopsis saalfeldensis TaxID=394193 RepID=A0A1H8YPJ3_9PSEU|nr:thymidylate synthase [Amycolatopsis saalfeldensis]SEP54090.1 thymidylate synthase [Amycolatopsis saalfeldensis]